MKSGKKIFSEVQIKNKKPITLVTRDRAAALRAARAALAAVSLGALFFFMPLTVAWSLAHAESQSINPWWPGDGARVEGVQPFKADVPGLDPSQYEMFWQVDGGTWNWMDNSSADFPHKEAQVDLSNWSWKGSGPYSVNFIARRNGAIIAQRSVAIYINGGFGSPASSSAAPLETKSTQAPAEATPQSAPAEIKKPEIGPSGSLKNLTLYVNKNSPAKSQADAWRWSRPDDAKKMDVLAGAPTASWFGGWSGNVEDSVRKVVSEAKNSGAAPVLVAYNIPGRDCGSYSAGGTQSKSDYVNWIGAFARGIGSADAVVILEPDALPGLDCLSSSDQDTRTSMLASAVSILKSHTNTRVYLDAGNATWKSAKDMAPRLARAGIAQADGFSLNVSGFEPTDSSAEYGKQLSSLLKGLTGQEKHFVIDTSRNGNGSNGEWCNPWGRAVGKWPTTNTGTGLADAYLWIKTPGESDGTCNGGPSAGQWWSDYALSLVK